ncbi:DUF6809 family protein [Cohnella sp. 56]|uniref:DUF6809 family protein n=1 Tax=Cohnella sp. 56 TaxID=3113722 RepID=UPI0030E7F261
MRKLLEKLYNGQLNPLEQIVSKDPAYHTINQQITKAMNLWKSRLGKEEYRELERLMDLRSQMEELDMLAAFEYGFQLGVSLMVETMASWGELLKEKDMN